MQASIVWFVINPIRSRCIFFWIQFCSFADCFPFYILSSRVLPYGSLYIFGNFLYTFRNWSRLILKLKTCKTLWYSVEDCCNAKCINSLVFLGYRISFNKRPRSNKRSTLNKHLPPKAIYQTSAPFPSPLNFLNGRDTRRNCINCHFIENILRFNYSRIRTRGQYAPPLPISAPSFQLKFYISTRAFSRRNTV